MKAFASRNIKSLIASIVFVLIVGMWFLPSFFQSFGSVRIGITLILGLCMLLMGIRQADQQHCWYKRPGILVGMGWLLLGLYIYVAYHVSVPLPVGVVGTVVLFVLMFVCAYMALVLARRER